MKNLIIIVSLFFIQCSQPQSNNFVQLGNQPIEHEIDEHNSDTVASHIDKVKIVKNRTAILKRLSNKINNNNPLIVHVYVPLCDNENQGIVPTSKSLGNGMSLKSNLYWATSKGMKRYFKELPEWKFIKNEYDIDSNVLERVIFKKTYNKNATVYLIADAYRGDRMNSCLADFFNALSGNRIDSTIIDQEKFEIGKNADLAIFNGHNGLMDDHPELLEPKPHFPKDAVAIACVSGSYFKGYYEYVNAYPLVNTNHLLYPGAFITEAIVNEWAELSSAQDCKIAAGKSYYKHKPKSGRNGAQNLFNYGYDF